MSFSNTLKLWGLAFRSLSQGVGSVMGVLGLFFFLHLVILLRLFLAALFDRVAVIVLYCLKFSFGAPSHASLEDRDAGPAFSSEHGHLGTMGEQCCALNGLPRFVNKNK